MTYRIEITKSAVKEMDALSSDVHRRIAQAILGLKTEPRPKQQCKKLQKPHEGYRIRVGTFRILYVVADEDGLITVYAVRHRREAYRKHRR